MLLRRWMERQQLRLRQRLRLWEQLRLQQRLRLRFLLLIPLGAAAPPLLNLPVVLQTPAGPPGLRRRSFVRRKSGGSR